MTSTYVNDLRLNEMATGDASGSWGTVTNTNLELIAEAFSFGTEGITTNADTHTTTIADGATDPGRSMFLKYTGTLDSACTITIAPNTISKLWFIENGTSGSQNIIISQGSGANITIPAGQTKAIYSDGAGSGAAMVDAFATLNVVDLLVDDDLTVTDDVAIGGLATIGETLAVTGVLTTTAATVFNGGFASNADSTMGTDKKLFFRDSAIHISSVNDGDLMIAADDEIDITSTLIDINGNVEIGGTIDATTSVSDAYFFRGSHATTTAFYITNTNATTNNVANLILAPANNVAGAYLSAIATEDFSVSGNRTADLAFYTRLNGTFGEQLRIDSSGNVGVNTASPDAIFTVDTNVGGSSTGTLARFHASKGESDSTFFQIAATRHGTASVQRVQLQAFDDDGSTGRTLSLNGSGGNVGIGTHEPDTLLQLSTATGPVLRFERNDTSITSGDLYGSIEFEGQDGSSSSAGVRAEIRVEGAGTGTQGETSILFKTSHTATTRNTEKMKIGNLGDVTVTSGNLVIGTSGKGIDFSAFSAPLSGMSNELLDRYEEGTYSPVLTGASSGTYAGVGSYVIVGKLITVSVTFNSIGTGLSGGLSVNLPIAANPQGSLDMYVPVQWFNLNWTSGALAQYGYITDGGATLLPYCSKDNASSVQIQGDALGTSTYLRFIVTYEIA